MTRNIVHTVNAIAFHPSEGGIVATAGSDGWFDLYDLVSRNWLEYFSACEMRGDVAITSCTFSADGDTLCVCGGGGLE
ncbi:hypothetical protein B0T14DRAFT_514923 [Immersiella caudata]|uniref:Uncharacterized protein n=1 Tax=Immersiella caudata TaxID=314043 RepID=A0AA39WWM8_9PEZI|nr:hypothetical protein B0T14DRAFT_514923 [Immersiella caudata]